MGQTRTSRKQVRAICEALGYELIVHQDLGNRKDYFYTYSMVDIQTREAIVSQKSLATIYNMATILLKEKCNKLSKEM